MVRKTGEGDGRLISLGEKILGRNNLLKRPGWHPGKNDSAAPAAFFEQGIFGAQVVSLSLFQLDGGALFHPICGSPGVDEQLAIEPKTECILPFNIKRVFAAGGCFHLAGPARGEGSAQRWVGKLALPTEVDRLINPA